MLAAWIIVVGLAGPAAPDSDDAIARAKVLVEEGQRLYESAQYDEALQAFEDAAATYASPDFQFNIGLCHERMGNYDPAIASFRTYLRNKPDAPDRVGVEQRIAQLQQLRDAQRTAPPQAEPSPPVSEPTPAPATGERDVTAPVVVAPSDGTDDGDRDDGRGLTISGGVLLATGVSLAIGGGIGFGLPSRRRRSDVRDVLEGGNPQMLGLEDTRSLAEGADRFRALQFSSIAVGAALATTGAVFVAVGRRRARDAQGRGARVRPSFGPGFGGLTVGGRL